MKTYLFPLFLLLLTRLVAQPVDFYVSLHPKDIPGFPGIQSAAVGSSNGVLVVLGGRTDGLHQRQPFASFSTSGQPAVITVIAPQTGAIWTAPVQSLPVGVAEQLKATNLNFYQEGPWLYLAGGYGYSPTAGDHITHNRLTVVRLDSLIQAVQAQQPIAPWFWSVQDESFAVTGGQMGKIGEVFYLAGGQRFDGRYNPMNHPTFVQTYTNAIRRFKASVSNGSLTYTLLPEWTDAMQLHRRDYSMAPQVFPDGRVGYTMFSGVFQQVLDLPYLNTVDFDSTGFTVNHVFQHRLNQYHSAHTALWDGSCNRMYSIFFGGISQYFFDDADQLQQDDNVPFVSTIGRVTRFPDGSMVEQKMGDLPGLLGASAEFVLNAGLPVVAGTEVVQLDQVAADSFALGYIVGGIESDQPNVFFDDPAGQSRAHATLYEVWLVKTANPVGIKTPVFESKAAKVQLQPNPASGITQLKYTLARRAHVGISLQAPDGRIIVQEDLGEEAAGEHTFEFRLQSFPIGSYPVILTVDQEMLNANLLIVK